MPDFVEEKKIQTNRTFSITHGHTLMITGLASELSLRHNRDISDSEVIRVAIDNLWALVFDGDGNA